MESLDRLFELNSQGEANDAPRDGAKTS